MTDITSRIRRDYAIQSLTRSGTTATASVSTSYNKLLVGEVIAISGVTNDTNWNGDWTITARPTSSTAEFTVPDTLTTPADGTIILGGDYDSVDAWQAANHGGTSADHLQDTERCIGELYDDWADGLETDVVLGSGVSDDTSATYNIVLRAAAGHAYDPLTGDGVYLVNDPAGSGHVIRARQNYTYYGGPGRGFMIKENYTAGQPLGNNSWAVWYSVVDGLTFDQRANDASNVISWLYSGSERGNIFHNVLILSEGMTESGDRGFNVSGHSSADHWFAHCAIVCSTGGLGHGWHMFTGTTAGYCRAYNCVGINVGTGGEVYRLNTSWGTSAGNASDDSTAPGSSSQDGILAGTDFVDNTADDWRPATGEQLDGTGVSTAGLGFWSLMDARTDQTVSHATRVDILGVARTQDDIGPFGLTTATGTAGPYLALLGVGRGG